MRPGLAPTRAATRCPGHGADERGRKVTTDAAEASGYGSVRMSEAYGSDAASVLGRLAARALTDQNTGEHR